MRNWTVCVSVCERRQQLTEANFHCLIIPVNHGRDLTDVGQTRSHHQTHKETCKIHQVACMYVERF